MNTKSDKNNPGLKIGDEISGCQIRRTADLREIDSIYYELKHQATGARHVHISTADKENTFIVAFKTVPSDSSGVAHILEHTVLCGSRRYPVRDPFFSMLKRSLSTFMNAFTASDWTMYPFATQNPKDFYNLMDVYLDAAFFPKLNELSFCQEGHRLEFEEGKDTEQSPAPLVYKGVVYNEMKGAMSSPSQVMGRSILNALYPETTYSNNSGGDPAVIPQLTHAQLLEFHRVHYHPSNAFFYTYGNLPLRDHLDFIQDKVLRHFTPIDPGTDVPSQPRWRRPQTVDYSYPLDPSETVVKKSQVCLAWLTCDIKDTFGVLCLTLLEQILLGNAASPLRKALIDSGLGSSLCDSTGFDGDNRDTSFVCGLKDVDKADAAKIESIILGVFKDLVNSGIDKEMIESAIHQLEFHRREVTNTPYPYGLKLLLFFSGSWFHGGDPVRSFDFDADLTRIRKQLKVEPFFENCIQKYFIDNPHRVLLHLVPDQEMAGREAEQTTAQLSEIRSCLTKDQIEKIKSRTDTLKRLQESHEDLAVLPTLDLSDIPPLVQSVQPGRTYDSVPAVCYNQPTAGIFYMAGAAGAGAVSADLLGLVPFFCYALPKIGTFRRDYLETARRIDRYTGGIGLAASPRTSFNEGGNSLPLVSLGGKCLVRNQQAMFDIIQELVFEHAFTDFSRLKNLLLEYRAGLESMVVQNGHQLAMSLAARNFNTTSAVRETWHGIHQLSLIKALTGDLTEEKLGAVSEDLAQLGKSLFTANNFKMAIVGEDNALSSSKTAVASIFKGFADHPQGGFDEPDVQCPDEIPNEGWYTSSAVSFVARAFAAVRMSHADAPALAVISKILRSMYLHREIREKGGAYGGFALFNAESGIFSFASYRDPHIHATLQAFTGAMEFINSGKFNNEDIKEAVLQVCSEIDKPDPPGPAARKAFYRRIVSLSDNARNQFKAGLLEISHQKIQQVAEKYFDPE
ncbi:MAG: insulinase family protein, partial [Deltaproteobacteria bacterium]|nr:insulinase family protein [Deltaproteobacteria bacterium]